MNVIDVLEFEEGYREKAYYCSENYPTIGIGTKLGPKGASLSNYEFKVSREAAGVLLKDELRDVTHRLLEHRWYIDMNEDRQAIIKSMAYQMGYHGLMKFKNMIAALERKDYSQASRESLDSRWAKQTPARAERHAAVIGYGSIDQVYEGLI